MKQFQKDHYPQMITAFISTLILSALVAECSAESYCTRVAGIFNTTDNGIACLQSALYNVTNCCFRCTATGTNLTRCGSLYNYGVTSCSINGTLQAKIESDCFGIGGTGSFECICNSGGNTSELYGTPAPSNAPTTSSPTNSPTSAPTNDASGPLANYGVLLTVFLLSVLFMCV